MSITSFIIQAVQTTPQDPLSPDLRSPGDSMGTTVARRRVVFSNPVGARRSVDSLARRGRGNESMSSRGQFHCLHTLLRLRDLIRKRHSVVSAIRSAMAAIRKALTTASRRAGDRAFRRAVETVAMPTGEFPTPYCLLWSHLVEQIRDARAAIQVCDSKYHSRHGTNSW